MTGLPRFNDYITFYMALDILGAPREQTMRVYRIIDDNNIEVVHLGKTALINRKQFIDAIVETDGTRTRARFSRWPVHIATLRLDEMVTVTEAADMLNLTPRQVYNLIKRRVLYPVNLSFWGGAYVLNEGDVEREAKRRELKQETLAKKKLPRWKHANAGL
jgi:hypothetical protein